LIEQELEVSAAAQLGRQVLVVAMLHHKVNLLKRLLVQVQHLAEAHGSVKGAPDQSGHQRISLALVRALFQTQLGQQGEQTVRTQVHVHQVALALLLQKGEVERVSEQRQTQVTGHVVLANEQSLCEPAHKLFGEQELD